ncbi:hypothetical protein BH11PSE2_BH11PSE2_13550 [soil metagenome]
MPRFMFKLEHKGDKHPVETLTLEDLAAAKCEAVKMIGKDLCEHPQAFWDADTYQVTVSDEGGLNLFSVVMMSVTAPAVGPPGGGV